MTAGTGSISLIMVVVVVIAVVTVMAVTTVARDRVWWVLLWHVDVVL